MPDNLEITAGTGTPIATDLVGTEHYQRIKLTDGLADASTPINADIGVKANALRVVPANNITDATYIGNVKVTSGAITETNSGAIKTAVELIDNAVDGNYLNVNLNAAGTDLSMNSGVLTAQTLRVTIATDDEVNNLLGTIDTDTGNMVTALEIMDDWDDANQCKVIIQTGANAIGTLAANSGIDIGDVDVTSIVPLTGATNLGKARDLVCGANDVGVMALAVRDDTLNTLTPADGDYVPLRVSSTGQLHVTGGGGGTEYTEDEATPAPIVGTATMMERDDIITTLTPVAVDWAAMRCSEEGALWTQDFNSDAILTALQLIDDAVDGNYLNVNLNIEGSDVTAGEGNIDAQTLRVTIATDDDGVAHLATIAGDTTGIETAVEIMDDWDATHDSAASADGAQLMAAYDSTKPTAVGDADAVRILADAYGRLLAGVEPQSFQAVYDSADASSEAEVVHASAPSTIIVVQSYVISVDAEMWVKLQDEASAALTGKFWLKAGGGVAITLPDKAPIVLGVDKDLEVITEGAGNISVSVTGYTIPG